MVEGWHLHWLCIIHTLVICNLAFHVWQDLHCIYYGTLCRLHIRLAGSAMAHLTTLTMQVAGCFHKEMLDVRLSP